MPKLRAARSPALIAGFVIVFGIVAAVGALAQPNVIITRPSVGQVVVGTFYIEIAFENVTPQPVTRLVLYVDGRPQLDYKLEAPRVQGSKTFAWRTDMLANGRHVLSALAYDAAGRSSPTAAAIHVFVQNAGGPGPGTPMPVPADKVPPTVAITGPENGATVSGKIEIGVEATDPSGIKYVILFVDDTFKELRNYPPFRFIQDTEKLENGLHSFQAAAMDETDLRGESAKVYVQVDNPRYATGMAAPPLPPSYASGPAAYAPPVPPGPPEHISTIVMTSPPSGRAGPPPSPVNPSVGAPAPGPAGTVIAMAPGHVPAPLLGATAMARTAPALSPGGTRVALLPESPFGLGVRGGAPTVTAPSPRATSPAASTPSEVNVGTAPMRTAALPSVGTKLSSPRGTPPHVVMAPRVVSVKPALSPAEAQPPAASSPKPTAGLDPLLQTSGQRGTPPRIASAAAPTTTSVKPRPAPAGAPLTARETRVAALPRPVAPLPEGTASLGDPRATMPGTGRDSGKHVVHLGGKEITVVFDDTQLDLLVAPMERAGIPVGPLREIFEHTNGVVHWYAKQKRVWARNDRTEVDLTIGDRNAKLNDEVTVLELAPFIVRGRTMVPLEFLKQALNVTVYFEPDTGHLIISSNDL
jgi:hypothetical protein